jgi:hypothetical protein
LSRRGFIAVIHEERKRLEAAGVTLGSKFLDELRAERGQLDPPAPLVFRNDHGARCTCLACVADRIGFRRRA